MLKDYIQYFSLYFAEHWEELPIYLNNFNLVYNLDIFLFKIENNLKILSN